MNSQPVHPACPCLPQVAVCMEWTSLDVARRPDGMTWPSARSVDRRCSDRTRSGRRRPARQDADRTLCPRIAGGSPKPMAQLCGTAAHAAAFASAEMSSHVLQDQGDQEGRARLLRRPRHLDHPEVAAEHLRLRGRDLHRRSRPGRGARAGAREGADARHQAGEHLHRGPARGVRARLRVPDVPRQRAVRGPLPARHLDRAAADRQEADRDRPRGRRRRRVPRRHRQGQRPGPLRAVAITRSSRASRSSRRGASGSSRAART